MGIYADFVSPLVEEGDERIGVCCRGAANPCRHGLDLLSMSR